MLHASLEAARRDQGLSQQDIATAMGVTQPTVAAFERYDNEPRMSNVRRYAQAGGVGVAHTVSREGVEVPCGWTVASSSGVTFAVSQSVSGRTMRVAGPEDASHDVDLEE